jgi:hypothetical protein
LDKISKLGDENNDNQMIDDNEDEEVASNPDKELNKTEEEVDNGFKRT